MLGMALVAILILIPLCGVYFCHLGLEKMLLFSIGKFFLRVGVLSGAMAFLVQNHSVWLCILFIALFAVYTIFTVVVKSGLPVKTYVLPVSAGLVVATGICCCVLAFAVISMDAGMAERFVLPLFALLCGSIVSPMAKSLTIYYMGLRHHNHLYYFLVGNGATRKEALDYLLRRALRKSVICGVRTVSATLVSVSPVVMWIMILCGKQVLDAMAMQLLVTLAGLAASVLSVWVALFVARRYVVDGYARIKDA